MAKNIKRSLCLIFGLCVITIWIGCGGASSAAINSTGSLAPVSISIDPQITTVPTDTVQAFTATVNNTTSTKVTWLVDGIPGGSASLGTVDKNGNYTAPLFVPTPSNVTVTAASNADNTAVANASVTITGPTAPGTVAISPTSVSLVVGDSQLFSATVSGGGDPSVNWLINGVLGGNATVGTILALPGSVGEANYTAPLTVPDGGIVSVTAQSVADPTQTASANITISATQAGGAQVTISPISTSVEATQSQPFTATVTGVNNTAVTWEVSGVPGGNINVGTINSSGVYTAPSQIPNPNQVTVTAVSVAQPSAQATATVSIVPFVPITVQVAPASANVLIGETQQFTATVLGANNQNVTWKVNNVVGGNSTVGTISTEGLYSAPATVPTPAQVTIQATSDENNSTTGTAQATIVSQATVTVALTPASPQTVQVGLGITFTATVSETGTTDAAVNFYVNGELGGDPTIGTIQEDSESGDVTTATYLAPLTVPSPAAVQVSAASAYDGTPSNSVSVTITPMPTYTFSISPTSATLMPGQSQPFSGIVSGPGGPPTDQTVYWTLSGPNCSGATCGTISPTTTTMNAQATTYTAPQTPPSPTPTVTVTATPDIDAGLVQTATVTVESNNPTISISPDPPNPLAAGSSPITFTITATNVPSGTIYNLDLGCISLADAGENCFDNDFDGDGPGCITIPGSVKKCGSYAQTETLTGSGGIVSATATYTPPTILNTGNFQPNACEQSNNGSGDGLVPITATLQANGCPSGGCQAVACITITP